jgi:superfamily I DNA and/or RNA helicase
MAGSEAKFSLLTGQATPAATAIKPLIENSLNANQREVLQKAIAAKDYFLVQGPPGTGKTSTFLTHLVTELQQQEGSMVIVAFTNRAVEEIAHRLTAKKISFLRLGSRQSESEARLRAMVEGGDIEAVSTHIKGHRIFLSTMAGRLESLKLLKPDLRTLVVDEASQLTEPQLVSLVMDFEKFILIGDQNQLPPVVAQDAGFCKVEDPLLQAIGLDDLRVSLFERLMQICKDRGWGHAWGMLTMHFRMHRDIADLINPWYGNQLVCGREEQEQAFAAAGQPGDDWHKVLSAGRAVFIPSPREITSKYHRTEAERVVSLLNYLKKTYGSAFTKDTVGVVTPWRTQIGLIRSLIGDDPVLQDLNIDTVERFQGSENDIIIVSLAVYHPAQLLMLNSPGRFGYSDEDGFKEIAVDRKLLVTLSRARKQVVFMGDEGVIKGNRDYVEVVGRMIKR